MIVCMCKGIRESDVQTVLASGMRDIKSVIECTSAGKDCGSCLVKLLKLVNQNTNEAD